MELLSLFLVLSSVVTIVLGAYDYGVLLFGDTDLTYHFGKNFFNLNNIYLWNDYFKAGIFDYDKFQAFYLKKIIFLINSVTDLYFFSYLWYFLPILLYGITFYFLIKEWMKICGVQNISLRINALILSIFAFVNGIFIIYYGQALVILSLVLLNVFLLYFTKNILYLNEYGKNNYRYLVLCGIALSQISIYIHTLFLLVYASLILIFLNYRFVFRYLKHFCIQGVILASLAFALNAQWILPVFLQSFLNDTSVRDLVVYDPELGWDQAKSISKNIYMFDLLKTKSYHIFENHAQYFNVFYFVPLGIILFFLTKRRRILSPFFVKILVFFILSLFFSYGIRPISESFYRILWDHLPFFTAFRTIFKFSFLYLYTLVFVLTYIFVVFGKNRKHLLVISLLFLNIAFSISYYFQPEAKRNLQQYTIPDYYFELETANLSETTRKLGNLMTSPQFNWQFQYKWAPEKIDGMNILPYFYGSGVFINGAQDTPDTQYVFNDYFDYQLRNNNLNTVKNLIGLRNIKYISFQDDLRITEDESTPYVVKSNFETTPTAGEVFSKKLTDEICSDVKNFGKLSFCRVKNSLFSSMVTAKNGAPILIKNKNYLNHLNESDYFVPYSQRDEKNFSKINLVEENPIILNDLVGLGISDSNSVRIFDDTTNGLWDDVKNKSLVYPSMKPFRVKNCFFQLGCDLYTFQDIEAGRYKVYLVRYPMANENIESREYSIDIFDKVEDDFIMGNIVNLKNRKDILDYKDYERTQGLTFSVKESVLVGEVALEDGNALVRMVLNDSSFNGRFYLVKETEHTQELVTTSPHIEFKKIDPTKFRVRVHKARDIFSLVLANNFDKNWNLFISKIPQEMMQDPDLSKYGIFRGNVQDQATVAELIEFIKDGFVTSVGFQENKKTPDRKPFIGFVSKDFHGSIQNDNLPDGKIWETWFQDSIQDNRNHFINDGYSNGWFVDPEEVCKDNAYCMRNNDGTYDMEFVIEFWPQRLFYPGLAVSLVVLFGCVFFLIFSYKRGLL